MTEENNENTNPPTLLPGNINLKLEQVPPPSPPLPPPPDIFQNLVAEENQLKVKDLYERLELKKGLIIKDAKSDDEDWVISKAFKKAIDWTGEPNWIVPRKNGFFTSQISTSLKAVEESKFSSEGSGTMESDLFSSDSDLELESESEFESDIEVKAKTYMLAEYTIPKVMLSVDWSIIKLEDEFKSKVEKALTNDDDDMSNFFKLNYLLSEYGYFVPLQLTIGAKISAQSKVDSNITYESKQFSSFQSSFASRLNLFNLQPPGMSGEAKGEIEREQEIKSKSESDLDLEYYGGIGSALTNPLGWAASLDYYQGWQVIKYPRYVPIISFFDEELLDKAANLFKRFSRDTDTNKPSLLNGRNYASTALFLAETERLLSEVSPQTVQKRLKRFTLACSD